MTVLIQNSASPPAPFDDRPADAWEECTLDEEALAYAHDLIALRRFVVGTDWAVHEPTEQDRQAYLESHPWEDYARWHLGRTQGARDETMPRYDFVVGDFTRVHRSALVACADRAATFADRRIHDAARLLLVELDRRTGIAN